jgi:peroxiredoxin Q/BCP
MSKKLEGKKCPKFNAECTSGITYSNKDFDGKNLVIYFYPKDSTPGCTSEGQEFRDNYKQFKKNNTEILGVSRDTIKSHENFKENVMKLKSMYGREYIGVDRSTFLINDKGIIIKEWRAVKVKGHVNEVLETVKGLS